MLLEKLDTHAKNETGPTIITSHTKLTQTRLNMNVRPQDYHKIPRREI